MKPVLLLALMLMGACRSYNEIQVDTTVASVERKEIHQSGKDDVVVQYWREKKHGILYAEWRPLHDTGFQIGTTALILVKK